MNRTIKDATVKAFHYESLESLKDHVLAFVAAYNFAKHLKALRWRTPFEAIQDAWTNDPSPFKINPHQLHPETKHLVLCVAGVAVTFETAARATETARRNRAGSASHRRALRGGSPRVSPHRCTTPRPPGPNRFITKAQNCSRPSRSSLFLRFNLASSPPASNAARRGPPRAMSALLIRALTSSRPMPPGSSRKPQALRITTALPTAKPTVPAGSAAMAGEEPRATANASVPRAPMRRLDNVCPTSWWR